MRRGFVIRIAELLGLLRWGGTWVCAIAEDLGERVGNEARYWRKRWGGRR